MYVHRRRRIRRKKDSSNISSSFFPCDSTSMSFACTPSYTGEEGRILDKKFNALALSTLIFALEAEARIFFFSEWKFDKHTYAFAHESLLFLWLGYVFALLIIKITETVPNTLQRVSLVQFWRVDKKTDIFKSCLRGHERRRCSILSFVFFTVFRWKEIFYRV